MTTPSPAPRAASSPSWGWVGVPWGHIFGLGTGLAFAVVVLLSGWTPRGVVVELIPFAAYLVAPLLVRVARARLDVGAGRLRLWHGRAGRAEQAWEQSLSVPLREVIVFRGYEGAAVTVHWADNTRWSLPGGFANLFPALGREFVARGLPPFTLRERPYVARNVAAGEPIP